MSRARTLYLFLALMAFIVIVIWLQRPCDCQVLEFDQHDGVGAFVSLPREPGGRVEVGPARIRAIPGEQITWVLRNPCNLDIVVHLSRVVTPGSSVNIIDEVFKFDGGSVRVRKGCGIAPLTARLEAKIFRAAEGDSCPKPVALNYFFMIEYLRGSGRDSSICKFDYDPELVVDRDP